MKFILAFISCFVAACAGLQSNVPGSMVGEWRYTDAIQSCRYAFDRDGSFRGEVVYKGKTISRFSGRWSVKGDTVFYTYNNDELGRIPAATIDRDKMIAVRGDYFVIQAVDGKLRKYIRIR